MASKYETLSVAQLREIVKAQGIKNTSTMRKQQLVQLVEELEGAAREIQSVHTDYKKAQHGLGETDVTKNMPAEEPATGDTQAEEFRASNSYENRNTERPDRQRRRIVNVRRDDSQVRSRERRPVNKDTRDGSAENTSRPYVSRENGNRDNRDNSSRESGIRDSGFRDSRDTRDNNRGYKAVERKAQINYDSEAVPAHLEGTDVATGILEILDGYGFLRSENYQKGANDVYISHTQIRRFNLKTGDVVTGTTREKKETEKARPLLYVKSVNGLPPEEAQKRPQFEKMTPIFPNQRLNLETPDCPVSMRIMNIISPIGRGQRGMIVSPPKTGKTTLLKQVAKAIHSNYPDINLIILLIDERPEEVTDIKEYIEGENVEVIYSTFDERPENHKEVSEMVLERAKRLVEHHQDVVILLDSITRLARAYNLTEASSGRTLSGGLDPAALYMPKRFFGAARNMREGGSLTILATALVETGSKMDDVVFEEFKGTGNMELVLDRKLSEKRIFPAINISKSGTRREELLLANDELDAAYVIHRAIGGMRSDESVEQILDMFARTRNNVEFVSQIRRTKFNKRPPQA